MSDAGRFSLQTYLREKKEIIEKFLENYLSKQTTHPAIIFEAAGYSLFAGGKRIRPILCIAAWEASGGDDDGDILPAACALELIHTYSLIHDDLPAMDNDDYRRGRLTNHRVYGEDIAILAGDGLLTEAFALLSRRDLMVNIDPAKRLQVIETVATAAGMQGLIGGQVLDLQAEGKNIGLDALQQMHNLKTGALIVASLKTGGILAGASQEVLDCLVAYGMRIGLTFQIADDLLNVEGDAAEMGKSTGSDARRGKATFPAFMSCEESRTLAARLTEEALGFLAGFDRKAEPLRQLARFILERKS